MGFDSRPDGDTPIIEQVILLRNTNIHASGPPGQSVGLELFRARIGNGRLRSQEYTTYREGRQQVEAGARRHAE